MKIIYSISFLALLFVSCSNPKLPITDLEEQKLRGNVFKVTTVENEVDTIIEIFNEAGYLLREINRDSNGLYSDWENFYDKSGIKYKAIKNFGRRIEDSVHFKFNKEGNFEEVINFQGKDTVRTEWSYDDKGIISTVIFFVNGRKESRWDYDITDSTAEIEMYIYDIESS